MSGNDKIKLIIKFIKKTEENKKVVTEISKEDFETIITELQKSSDYQKGLNRYFKNHDVDGYIYQPDCSCSVYKLLHILFGELDNEEWINMFCFDFDFGRKYKDSLKDECGNIIPFSTIDDLYNVLTANTRRCI